MTLEDLQRRMKELDDYIKLEGSKLDAMSLDELAIKYIGDDYTSFRKKDFPILYLFRTEDPQAKGKEFPQKYENLPPETEEDRKGAELFLELARTTPLVFDCTKYSVLAYRVAILKNDLDK
tara:strand:- start:30908 stop:31270 length:363 start_codon:yes stop_codon:yes gene_type:complete